MSSLPALLLAFEQLSTHAYGDEPDREHDDPEPPTRERDDPEPPAREREGLRGAGLTPGEPRGDGVRVDTSPDLPPLPATLPGMKEDKFTRMDLLLSSTVTPQAVNRSGQWTRIAPFATYILHRVPMARGVQFTSYTDPTREVTVLFINPDEQKGNDYIPLINAFKNGGDLNSATITYQWPVADPDKDAIYARNSADHFKKLYQEAADYRQGDKHNESFCSVFVFVKVGKMKRDDASGKFLCLGRFEVTPNQYQSRNPRNPRNPRSTTLKLFRPPVPLAAHSGPLPDANPTYDADDVSSVTSNLSGGGQGLSLAEVQR